MQQHSDKGTIVSGFNAWIQASPRAASKKIEFGNWWRLEATYWRVIWLEATEELYAAERGKSDRFMFLTHLTKAELKVLMNKWFDGDNLSALLQRLGLAPA